jgi:hypothetical protein
LGILALQGLSSKWTIDADDATIEYQCSSIGKLEPKWLSDVFRCAVRKPTCNSADRFRIVFPSTSHVLKSPLGPGAFGTIFSKKKDWNAIVALRHCFYKCEAIGFSARPLHTKVMTIAEKEELKFYYLGSANFTPSAWGRLVKEDRQMMICNYELGVLLDAKDFPPIYPYTRPPDQYDPDDCPWAQS